MSAVVSRAELKGNVIDGPRLRDKERSSVMEEELGLESLLLCIETSKTS